MKRTFVIGDVHGCLAELTLLVEKLAPVPGDVFVFLGDLVDKGPDSIGVIRYVRDLLTRFHGSLSIGGNHEEKAIRLLLKFAETRDRSIFPADEAWMLDAKVEDVTWLASFPLVHRLEGHAQKFIAVHGGFYPKFFEHYPEGIGQVPAAWHKGGGKKTDRARKFLRVRVVDAEGEFVQLSEQKPEHKRWAEVYDGREGFAFYGHEPFDEVVEDRHAMGLDTSCVFGGKLTAAVLKTGTLTAAGKSELATNIEIVQVAALKKYRERRITAE